ncbi:hypothetical protein [Mobilicoccus sp.]|uniref:hypothetical protein n=1 Tax=Mobilicoccus sp. TaxID=2034349 RepID=UPI0028AAE55B|nr:hypothetical protein [Mobilicoccus sp.]
MSIATSQVDPVRQARANVAVAVRLGKDATEARRTLHAAKLERAIMEAVNAAPPLTADQRATLAQLLTSGGGR